MESTLFLRRVFPPPAPGTEIFALADGSCTRRTTNAYKTLVVQRVVRDVVLANEVAHLIESPVEERVKFEELVRRVPFQ